jgi:hypothetical protein
MTRYLGLPPALWFALAASGVFATIASQLPVHSSESYIVQAKLAKRQLQLADNTANITTTTSTQVPTADGQPRMRTAIAPAASDPFFPPPPAPPPAPPVEPAPTVATVTSTPPAPPVFSYQLFGRIQKPDGKPQVFLSRNDSVVPITEGTELDGGYRVESISAEEVLIRHRSSDQQLRLTFPRQVQ